MGAITEHVRRRVLRWFARSGLLEPAEARAMLGWTHGGFSLEAAVRIARYLWAMLLARLFEALPLVCPNCGANLRVIAFITEAAPVEQILLALGEPPRPPPISPARGPPAWDEAPEPAPDWDLVAQPEPEFDQRITW